MFNLSIFETKVKKKNDSPKENVKQYTIEKDALIKRRWRRKHPQKARAQNTITHKLQKDKIERPKVCSNCGMECKPEAHHPDYKKPLEVKWLCRKCHIDTHSEVLHNQSGRKREKSVLRRDRINIDYRRVWWQNFFLKLQPINIDELTNKQVIELVKDYYLSRKKNLGDTIVTVSSDMNLHYYALYKIKNGGISENMVIACKYYFLKLQIANSKTNLTPERCPLDIPPQKTSPIGDAPAILTSEASDEHNKK